MSLSWKPLALRVQLSLSPAKKKIGRDTANELELAVGLEEDEPTKNIPPIIRIIISAVERDATVEEKEV